MTHCRGHIALHLPSGRRSAFLFDRNARREKKARLFYLLRLEMALAASPSYNDNNYNFSDNRTQLMLYNQAKLAHSPARGERMQRHRWLRVREANEKLKRAHTKIFVPVVAGKLFDPLHSGSGGGRRAHWLSRCITYFSLCAQMNTARPFRIISIKYFYFILFNSFG